MDDDCLDLKSLLSICLFFFCRTQYYPLYRSHVYDDFHEIRFDRFVFFLEYYIIRRVLSLCNSRRCFKFVCVCVCICSFVTKIR